MTARNAAKVGVAVVLGLWAAASAALAAEGASSVAAAGAESPTVLLEKGIYQEETVGDIDAAMKTYRLVVERAKAARGPAAQALYRLGLCHLKKGEKDAAAAAFRQVAEQYGEQKDVAAKARAELGKLGVVAAAAPHAVGTIPNAFARDVDPALDKILVTFDRRMRDGSWSWCRGGGEFPEKNGDISYDASGTTCIMPVKLQPGKVYWVSINHPQYQNFVSADGTPAVRYVILFATKSADGKATPLPEDLVQQAQSINAAAATVPADKAAQLKGWVEDFFQHNYRDVTARKTLEWGEPETDAQGNLSIRYKYLATIWDKDKVVIEDLFTFTPEGKFVAVKKLSSTAANVAAPNAGAVAAEGREKLKEAQAYERKAWDTNPSGVLQAYEDIVDYYANTPAAKEAQAAIDRLAKSGTVEGVRTPMVALPGLTVRSYDVFDLVGEGTPALVIPEACLKPGVFSAGLAVPAERPAQKDLRRQIEEQIHSSESWEQAGGRAVMRFAAHEAKLAVRQTPEAHEQINRLLEGLHRNRLNQPMIEVKSRFILSDIADAKAMSEWLIKELPLKGKMATIEKGPTGLIEHCVLNKDQVVAFLAEIKKLKGTKTLDDPNPLFIIWSGQRSSTANGTAYRLSLPRSDRPGQPPEPVQLVLGRELDFKAVASADRHSVLLSLWPRIVLPLQETDDAEKAASALLVSDGRYASAGIPDGNTILLRLQLDLRSVNGFAESPGAESPFQPVYGWLPNSSVFTGKEADKTVWLLVQAKFFDEPSAVDVMSGEKPAGNQGVAPATSESATPAKGQ